MVADLKESYSRGGIREVLFSVVSFAYKRLVRPLLPQAGFVLYEGIPVSEDRKIGDSFRILVYRKSKE